jgi:hypothetical protein
MGEHLRLAGAEMGARDLIVLWGLGFSSTSRHTKNDASTRRACRFFVQIK